MSRLLRILLIVFISFFILIVSAWCFMGWYISSHKTELLAKITDSFEEHTSGALVIKDMKPSLWKSFPYISLTLLDFSLRDSLYQQHHHDLVSAQKLYVQVNTWRLLTGHTEIRKITIADGGVYLYTDSTGYSNTSIFAQNKKTEQTDTTNGSLQGLIKNIALENVHFTLDQQEKNKKFNFQIHDFDGVMTSTDNKIKIRFFTDILVQDFAFNLDNGSFIQNQQVVIKGYAIIDPIEKSISFPEQKIKVGTENLLFTGLFYPARKPFAFRIRTRAQEINYANASKFLSPNITKKLNWFKLDKPVSVDAVIDGLKPFKGTPLIYTKWEATDISVISRFGNVTNGSFKGYYHNEMKKGAGHGDENSIIHISNFSGTWNNVPVKAEKIAIINLTLPQLDLKFTSHFPLTAMNKTIGGNAFHFSGGSATANLHYLGGIISTDKRPYSLDGTLNIRGGTLSYIPYKLPLAGLNANIEFRKDDVFFRNMTMHSKNSSLTLNGEAYHLLRFYFENPNNITINLKLNSPMIDMNEFKGFLTKNERNLAVAKVKTGKGDEGLNRIGNQLGLVLDASTINLDATVKRLEYNHFVATNIVAKTYLARSGIKVNHVRLDQSGGTMEMEGLIHQDLPNNPFEVTATVDKVHVAGIFTAFDNFGQDGVVAENLEGNISAKAHINGKMTESGGLLTNSLKGTVAFNLVDGALKQYDPLLKISKIAFKKRNLSYVAFKDIRNTLDIEGKKITINPMIIRSNALNMRIRGTYETPKGTDIFIEIPLRNPGKDELQEAIDADNKHLNKKGIVVYLRAQDGDEKGVKISWDPFKKYLKEHNLSSSEELEEETQ